MAGILRGEIRWADLNPDKGKQQAEPRPVVIISRDIFNMRSGTVIAMTITSRPQRAGFPLTLELRPGVMPKPSWIKIGQIRTLSTERIGEKIASLSPDELDHIIEGFNEIIGK